MNNIIQGDCLTVLKTMPSEFVDCVVTSPPYWGLRDYGTAQWRGGDANCDHKKLSQGRPTWGEGSTNSSTLKGRPTNDNHEQEAHYLDICGKCGAIRIDQQLGLEKTPEEYVDKMVEIFREVRRVLKPDGTAWLNLGDSYTGGGRGSGYSEKQDSNRGTVDMPRSIVARGLKPKDLVGIPWRVAFALQADGWWLRQDIIWHKPNPMPESVTDRCTKAHEYIFLLAKAEKYYYDQDATKEPMESYRPDMATKGIRTGLAYLQQTKIANNSVKNLQNKGLTTHTMHIKRADGVGEPETNGLRNRRSVWTVATAPCSEAHFATFPPELIRPCIQAGCPKDGVVLDPFMGAGTTAMVAAQENRQWIGIELNPAYIEIANKRIATVEKGVTIQEFKQGQSTLF